MAQIVPAVVVAIFVFAVGTQFVVAQVVPPARGTRAVGFLRGRHLEWTLSPALALTPLSALALVLQDFLAWPLASALMLGAVVYLIVATGCLLNILREATGPNAFRELLGGRHRTALQDLLTNREGNEQGKKKAIDELFRVLRTLRGWTRTSATAGDSRELLVALEGTLQLIVDYRAARLPADQLSVPTSYEENTRQSDTSLLRPEVQDRRPVPEDLKEWEYWVPPPYPPEAGSKQPTYDAGNQGNAEALELDRKMLPRLWVAHEVGRSLVRAVEFATTTKSLLDRDRARLLLALEKAARRFAEEPVITEDGGVGRQHRTNGVMKQGANEIKGDPDPCSAGVIVAHLVELGLGARRCEPADVDWHFEPLARLAVLHWHFQDRRNKDHDEVLAVGTAAAVLKVTEAITMARVSAHCDRLRGPTRTRQLDYENRFVPAIVSKTVADLRNISDVGQQFTLFGTRSTPEVETLVPLVIKLAESKVLEPRDRDNIYPSNSRMLTLVNEALQRNYEAETSDDGPHSAPRRG